MAFSSRKRGSDQPRRRVVSSEDSPQRDTSTFRRNQTMSGIRRQQDDADSHRIRTHHLAAHRRRVSGIFALVLIIILLLTFLLFQFTARANVTISSDQISTPLNSDEYEKNINEYFAIHPVERLRFMLNEQELSQFIANASPEVSAISVSGTENIIESDFAVTLRHPVAGWQINNKQYYVDAHGVVFQKNYYSTPPVQIIDQSGVSPEQGSTVASSRLLSFVGKVVSEAGEKGYTAETAVLPVGTTRQIEVKFKDIQSAIRFTIDREAAPQIDDMIHSVTFLQSRGQVAEYIDVRVEGKAVYR